MLKATALFTAVLLVSPTLFADTPRKKAAEHRAAVRATKPKPSVALGTWMRRFRAKQSEAERLLRRTTIETPTATGENVNLAVTDKDMRIPVRIVRVRSKTSRTPGFAVMAEGDRMNGVGTCYLVTEPKGLVGIRIKVRVGNKAGRGTLVTTYVPCTQEFRTPELIAEGRRYLERGTHRARLRHLARGVASLAYSDKNVGNVMHQRHQVAKVITEHIDPKKFIEEGKPRKTIEAVLASIGANLDAAYAFAWSEVQKDNPARGIKKGDAVAGGLVQFICPSYEYVRDAYPKARLSPTNAERPRLKKGEKSPYKCRRISQRQFVAAMHDHRNAFLAMYLHDDYCFSKLREADARIARSLRQRGRLAFGRWLAAAYNGGYGAAVPAIIKNPGNWIGDAKNLAKESRGYVVVFTEAYRYLYGND